MSHLSQFTLDLSIYKIKEHIRRLIIIREEIHNVINCDYSQFINFNKITNSKKRKEIKSNHTITILKYLRTKDYYYYKIIRIRMN